MGGSTIHCLLKTRRPLLDHHHRLPRHLPRHPLGHLKQMVRPNQGKNYGTMDSRHVFPARHSMDGGSIALSQSPVPHGPS